MAENYERGYEEGHRDGWDLAVLHAAQGAIVNPTPSTIGNAPSDPVNHPPHYTKYPVEVIELTRHMSFGRGNAVKYIARAGLKSKETELEDLRKALFYIQDEIAMLEGKA